LLFISLVRLPGPGTVCFGETPGSQNEPEWGWSCSCTLTVASGGPSLLVELMGEQDPVSWMIRVEELRITSSEDGTERNWTGLEAFHHEGADREGYLVFEDMNFDGFMDLKFYLEDLLHKQVDLVTEQALRPQLRSAIEEELIHVA